MVREPESRTLERIRISSVSTLVLLGGISLILTLVYFFAGTWAYRRRHMRAP